MDIVADSLRKGLIRHPDHDAVVAGDRRRTFRELDERAARLARALLTLGLAPGDRFALLARNVLEYPEVEVAAQRAGLILVPLNYRLTVPELRFITEDCGARLLIHGDGFADTARQLDLPTWHLGDTGEGDPYEEIVAAHGRIEPAPLLMATPTRILYTSGTTGRPKGAVLTNRSLWARAMTFGVDVGIDEHQRFVQALPMFHIASNTTLGFTFNGATAILMDFDAAGIVDVLRVQRATHVLLVPTMINMICNLPGIDDGPFPDLEMVLYGASSIAPTVLTRAIEVFDCRFFQFFGMTETSGCTILLPEHHDPTGRPDLLASAGVEATGFETRIVGPDDVDVPSGQVGEIVCRGPHLMSGYWNRPDATAEALRNGWMHTGDAGYRTEEGFLYVTDRIKDMIVTGGENVYPREVEDVFFEHPAVLEAAVIGVPDERWGERVHAVVVLRSGHPAGTDDLIAFVRERVAGYKAPKTLEFVDSLPRNATGKVLKTELRARHTTHST